jgi:hypothetical protein
VIGLGSAGLRFPVFCPAPCFHFDNNDEVGLPWLKPPNSPLRKRSKSRAAAIRRKSKNARHDEKMDALDEEIKRMRAQRLRLDRKRHKGD